MSNPQPTDHDEGVEDLCTVTTVHTFDTNYFVENLTVRPSGQILVTVYNMNELIEIDPRGATPPKTVHRFDQNITGIVEFGHDIFYVSTGTIGEQGSWAVQRVDMSASPSAAVSKVVDIPEAVFLNGSTLLDPAKGIILAADSILGAVFAIDSQSTPPSVTKWLQDPALAKVSDNPFMPGVNGIKVYNKNLFLSNTDTKTFLSTPIAASGDAAGPVEVAFDKVNIDDFIFDAEGNAYVTTHVFNSILKISKDGTRKRIAGGPEDEVVAGTTAVAFGRMDDDRRTLYATTNGGMSNPVKGKVGPARLLAVAVGGN